MLQKRTEASKAETEHKVYHRRSKISDLALMEKPETPIKPKSHRFYCRKKVRKDLSTSSEALNFEFTVFPKESNVASFLDSVGSIDLNKSVFDPMDLLNCGTEYNKGSGEYSKGLVDEKSVEFFGSEQSNKVLSELVTPIINKNHAKVFDTASWSSSSDNSGMGLSTVENPGSGNLDHQDTTPSSLHNCDPVSHSSVNSNSQQHHENPGSKNFDHQDTTPSSAHNSDPVIHSSVNSDLQQHDENPGSENLDHQDTTQSPAHKSDPFINSLVDSNLQQRDGIHFFPGELGFLFVMKSPESGTTQNNPRESLESGKEQKKAKDPPKVPPKKVKKKVHRPKIMVDQKPRATARSTAKPATPKKRNRSRKRKKEMDGKQEEVLVDPETPDPIQKRTSVGKKLREEKSVSKDVVRVLDFQAGTQSREVPREKNAFTGNIIGQELAVKGPDIGSVTLSKAIMVRHPNYDCENLMEITELKRATTRSAHQNVGGSRRLIARSKCLILSKKLGPNFPERLKRKRMLRMWRVNFANFRFQTESLLCFPEAVPLSWKTKGKRFKRIRPATANGIGNKFPVSSETLLEVQAKPEMLPSIAKGEDPLFLVDENQLPWYGMHSVVNEEAQNGKTEGSSLDGGIDQIEITHYESQPIGNNLYSNAFERWTEMVPAGAGFFSFDINLGVDEESITKYGYPITSQQDNASFMSLKHNPLLQKNFWLDVYNSHITAAELGIHKEYIIPVMHEGSRVGYGDNLSTTCANNVTALPLDYVSDVMLDSIIQKMSHLDINDEVHKSNAQVVATKKGRTHRGKKKQNLERSMVLIQGLDWMPNSLIPYKEPSKKKMKVPKKKQNAEEQSIVLFQRPNSLIPYEEPSKKKMKAPKVEIDEESLIAWDLLVKGEVLEKIGKMLEKDREVTQGRVHVFIKINHLVQGDRKFKQWKGSVVDSVVGVFLTQNVSDYLSSNAYITLAAMNPLQSSSNQTKNSEESRGCNGSDSRQDKIEKNSKAQLYFVTEPVDEKENVSYSSKLLGDEKTSCVEKENASYSSKLAGDEKISCLKEIEDMKSVCSSFSPQPLNEQSQRGRAQEPKEQQSATMKKKKKKKIAKEKIDWKSIRQMYAKEGPRTRDQMDSVDWETVRATPLAKLANDIKDRGQQTVIAGRIKEFLNKEVEEFQTIDMEWLRDAPPDLVKEYLLEVNGLGLKSVECIRLLALKHVAFPVDTNVARIVVRLGWVPLEPLPDEVRIDLLEQYPLLDQIQKYLWPRLCTLDQETLYELHYQMITFGKVFCTKRSPNCNACPMKAECRHFASAFASTRLALPGPIEKSAETTEASVMAVEKAAMVEPTSITLLDDNDCSPESGCQRDICEPIIEMPTSPACDAVESPKRDIEEQANQCSSNEILNIDLDTKELQSSAQDSVVPDIEDFPVGCSRYDVPTIDMDMEQFRKTVEVIMRSTKTRMVHNGDMSRVLESLNPEDASLPKPRIKYINHLRTEHVVYELPDKHQLLEGFEEREPDDPTPYLLAVWAPGDIADSYKPPEKRCNSQGSELCDDQTCSSCSNAREQSSNMIRGTILIPCRTAMRASFPLNGTYFQINEVFADHETSHNPIIFSRDLVGKLRPRAVYFGSGIPAIFRGLTLQRIQLCFWFGFVCVRAFDRKSRTPQELSRRLHCAPSKADKKTRGPNKVKPKTQTQMQTQ